jgi:hypothetical protein
MKKIVKIVFSCSAIAVIPVLFFIASVYLHFHSGRYHRDQRTCTQYYVGKSKGMLWEYGEWHHYVDFEVDASTPAQDWRVTDAPLPSSIWKEYSTSSVVRVWYRGPSNWENPFPASDWKICALSSRYVQ